MLRVDRRPVGVVLVALVAVVLLALASTVQAAFTLAAATYLLKGTQAVGNTTSDQEVVELQTPWIIGTTGAAPPEPIIVVNYPASFWPVSAGGLSEPTFDQSVAAGVAALPSPKSVEPGTVFAGGSQGAVVVSLYKREFNQAWAKHPPKDPAIIVVLIENPMRPNGGILESLAPLGTIPIFEITFYGATPTQTAGAGKGEVTTYDISFQYNVFSDFPTNPLFVLSDINTLMYVFAYFVSTISVQDAVLQDEYGDTRYYLVPTYPVPILMPLELIPTVGPILADMLDPAVRPLVEAGYDRTISPGQPTPANFRYFPDPTALVDSLRIAMPTGLDNGLQDIFGVRPFGTQRPDVMGQGAYGINGPPVTRNPTTNEQTASTLSEPVPSNTDNLTVPTKLSPAVVEPVPAPSRDTPPTHSQPLRDVKVDTANPPTTPRATQTTETTTSTPLATNSTRPKIRRPIGSDLLSKNLTRPKIRGPIASDLLSKNLTRPSPVSAFNKPPTGTTSATTSAAITTGNGSPFRGGSHGALNRASGSASR